MLLEIYKIPSGYRFENDAVIYNEQEKTYVKFRFFKQDIKKYDEETELEIFMTDIWKMYLHNYDVPFRSSFEITNKKYIIFFEI